MRTIGANRLYSSLAVMNLPVYKIKKYFTISNNIAAKKAPKKAYRQGTYVFGITLYKKKKPKNTSATLIAEENRLDSSHL